VLRWKALAAWDKAETAAEELGPLESLWTRTDAAPAWRLEVTAPECAELQCLAHDLDNARADSDVPPGYAWCLTKEKQHPTEERAVMLTVTPLPDVDLDQVEARAKEYGMG
jgi:hypothetical protein